LALGGARGCAEEPWYVARKEPARNALLVVQRHEQQRLEASSVATGALHWLSPPRHGSFPAQIRLRHRQPTQSAQVHVLRDGSAQISFQQPQRAATPGQFAVIYERERCLGGGVVERAGLDS
jgi:tRNA-uridine 2-sulfurtransferase